MERVYNFSPGPSMLAQPVLEKAQKDLMVYGNTGMSVMEMSHRSKMYTDIFDKTVADLRALMHIGDDYEVLLLQGGATLQFSAIPLESDGQGQGGLCRFREFRAPCRRGSKALRRSQYRRDQPRGQLHLRSRHGGGEVRPRRGLRSHHPEQHHLRHAVCGTAGCQSAPCCRRKLHDSLRTDGCEPLRGDLRRGTEEHRPVRPGAS